MITGIALSRVPVKFIFKGMRAIYFLLLITMVFNLVLTPGEPLVQIWKIKITREGIKIAIMMGVRLVFLITGSSLMTLTTTPNNLTDGLEDLLKPLKKILPLSLREGVIMDAHIQPIFFTWKL